MNLQVRPVYNDSADLNFLRDMRKSLIGENPANEESFDYWEDLRDRCSYIFGFYLSNELIGGVRLTPIGHGMTMGEKYLNLIKYLDSPYQTMEVNRLVIGEGARGHGVMSAALRSCFQWTLENTTHGFLIALCSPRLVPLYRRVGASVLVSDVPSKTVANKQYSLINLNLKDIKK
jgi:RimJ/RimL family protein N-acetyltransferase